jgi:hypothetical protein
MLASSPEHELLLCCARTARSPETAGRIATLLREDLDWKRVLRLAREHRLSSLLYWQLSGACPEAVPKDTLSQLRDGFGANHLRNLYLTGELLRLLKELEGSGIPAIPYKGPVMAAAVYGNLALREFGDLDILVRKGDVLKAREILTSLGYESHYRMTPAQEAFLLDYDRQYTFLRDDGCVVELHWTVAPRPVYFLLSPEYLWERAERVALGGANVASFSAEDLLLILSVHGAVHLWERIGWICDIAELVRGAESVDWERLVERARALSCKRMLLLGLLLANDLLDAVPPEKVLREARAEAEVNALAADVQARLFSEDPGARELFEGSARWQFHFRMIERLRDKLRYCVHRATTPTLSDWELVQLPVILFPCYPLLRPMRLGEKLKRSLSEHPW